MVSIQEFGRAPKWVVIRPIDHGQLLYGPSLPEYFAPRPLDFAGGDVPWFP